MVAWFYSLFLSDSVMFVFSPDTVMPGGFIRGGCTSCLCFCMIVSWFQFIVCFL